MIELVYSILKSKTFIAIITALSTWVSRILWERYFNLKPKLFLSISEPQFSQRNLQNNFFIFEWKLELNIKNNSKHTAYNIELIFPKNSNISDKQSILKFLKKNNHLESHKEISFEVESILKIPAKDHIKREKGNDGFNYISFNVKNENPKYTLMPEKIKEINLYIKYQNEKGAFFYTKYSNKYHKELNLLCYLEPKF